MRIVTIGANNLAFSHGHMRRTQQLSFSLQVTLATNFNFRPIDAERSDIRQFGKLFAAGFLHHCMAIHASKPAAGMCASLPIGLHSPLMATETSLVLSLGGFAGIFAKRDQPADSFTAARRHVIAPGPVAVFTSPSFRFVTRIEEKNFPHYRLGKFLELFGVAALANFVADVRSRRFFCGFLGRFFERLFFRGPSEIRDAK